MDKPVYLWQATLDYSKIIMYEFHYKYMKPKYGENLWLCYRDTNSFVYNIKTDDFYKDIADDVEARFNTSGYSSSRVRPLSIGVNKKVIGLMKNELGGRIMTEIMAVRLKLYAFKMLNGGGDKKCKGVKRCVVKKMLDFDDYTQCLLAGQNAFRKQLLLQNKLQGVHTTEVNKIALSRNNNKRVIQKDGVSTLVPCAKPVHAKPAGAKPALAEKQCEDLSNDETQACDEDEARVS